MIKERCDNRYEIVEAIEEHCGNEKFVLEVLKELKDILIESELKDLVNEKINCICRRNYLCNNCFHELYSYQEQEYLGEYHGFPAYEQVTKFACSNCGKRFEN